MPRIVAQPRKQREPERHSEYRMQLCRYLATLRIGVGSLKRLNSESQELSVPRISLPEGASVHCIVDDFLWPWDGSTPVLMMHGFARNATFWNRWVPAIAEHHRVYRPDLLGCGLSDQPPAGYRYT